VYSVVAHVTEAWGSLCSDAGQNVWSYITMLETRFWYTPTAFLQKALPGTILLQYQLESKNGHM